MIGIKFQNTLTFNFRIITDERKATVSICLLLEFNENDSYISFIRDGSFNILFTVSKGHRLKFIFCNKRVCEIRAPESPFQIFRENMKKKKIAVQCSLDLKMYRIQINGFHLRKVGPKLSFPELPAFQFFEKSLR